MEGAASFHTTRWTIVMGAVRQLPDQAQEEQTAMAEIDEEIRALCDVLVASEGRSARISLHSGGSMLANHLAASGFVLPHRISLEYALVVLTPWRPKHYAI